MNRHRSEPTVLDRLQVGGLRAEIVAEWRARQKAARAMGDAHRKRRACRCALCESATTEVTPWAPTAVACRSWGVAILYRRHTQQSRSCIYPYYVRNLGQSSRERRRATEAAGHRRRMAAPAGTVHLRALRRADAGLHGTPQALLLAEVPGARLEGEAMTTPLRRYCDIHGCDRLRAPIGDWCLEHRSEQAPRLYLRWDGGPVRSCPRCHLPLPVDAFPVDPKGRPRSTCRPCRNSANQEWRRRHRGELLARRRAANAARRISTPNR